MTTTRWTLIVWLFVAMAVHITVSSKEETCSGFDDTCSADTTDPPGEPQSVPDEKTRQVVEKSLEYFDNIVSIQPDYAKVRNKCKNQHKDCSYWASLGECKANAAYMKINCAPACQTCEWLDVSSRCRWDPNQPLAWNQAGGDLNKMFTRITTDPEFEPYHPQILSRPSPQDPAKDGPWVVVLDDFLSEQECEALIQHGADRGYERSMGGSAEKGENGEYLSEVSDYRTSYQAWCLGDCYQSEVAHNVSERISHLTGIGEIHSEYLQLLKYEPGQYYKQHHDFIETHLERPMGPRLITVFLYLNNVEEGGGTTFPDLGLIVEPKRGRALVWPSVTNENPMVMDHRTEHEALPVIKGKKFGANAWLHLGNFKQAFEDYCHFT